MFGIDFLLHSGGRLCVRLVLNSRCYLVLKPLAYRKEKNRKKRRYSNNLNGVVAMARETFSWFMIAFDRESGRCYIVRSALYIRNLLSV